MANDLAECLGFAGGSGAVRPFAAGVGRVRRLSVRLWPIADLPPRDWAALLASSSADLFAASSASFESVVALCDNVGLVVCSLDYPQRNALTGTSDIYRCKTDKQSQRRYDLKIDQ